MRLLTRLELALRSQSTTDAAADLTYNLVDYKDHGRLKTSAGRVSTPGRKQLFRAYAPSGSFFADLVGIVDEGAATVTREFKPIPAKTVQLMDTVFDNGRRITPRPKICRGARAPDERTDRLRCPLQDHPAAGGVSGANSLTALGALVTSEKLRADKRQD